MIKMTKQKNMFEINSTLTALEQEMFNIMNKTERQEKIKI